MRYFCNIDLSPIINYMEGPKILTIQIELLVDHLVEKDLYCRLVVVP